MKFFKIKKIILQRVLVVAIGILFFLGLSIAFRYYAESDMETPSAEILDE